VLLNVFERIARKLQPEQHVFESLQELDTALGLIGRTLGDCSTFYYEWGSRDRRPYALRPIVYETKRPYQRPVYLDPALRPTRKAARVVRELARIARTGDCGPS